jgi:type II secretory pathway pseudopilin PulG
LAEVMVAITLVSMLVAGAVGLLTSASQAIESSRTQTTATLLAAQKIEEVRSATVVTVGTREDHLGLDGVQTERARARFIRRWTVAPSWATTSLSSVRVEVFVVGRNRRVAELFGVLPLERLGGS